MHMRLLGWAGVQLRDGDGDGGGGGSLVIDPLRDPAAVWALAGGRARGVPMPALVAADPPGRAAAGLVTHLHRDHADAAALVAALAPGAPVLVPQPYGGSEREQASVAEADAQLRASGLELRPMAPWETTELGGFQVTALPAADGLGDSQVSWLVRRDGVSVVHAGDTLTHGWWWRIAQRAGGHVDAALLPVNGPRVRFPHLRPASPLRAAMNAQEAAVAAELLGARLLVPVHYGAYLFPSVYEPDPDPLAALAAHGGAARVLTPALGEWVDIAAAAGGPVAAAGTGEAVAS